MGNNGYNKFYVTVTDERGRQVDSDLISSVTVFGSATETAATIYQDDQGNSALTNPATTMTSGSTLEWFGSAPYYDVVVTLTNGASARQKVTTSDVFVTVPTTSTATSIPSVPTANSSTVSATTVQIAPFRYQTRIKLASAQLEMNASGGTDDESYGSLQLLDMPKGVISVLGANGHVAFSMANTQSQYFNDATPEGDWSVGTTAVDAAEDLGTDTSDDNIIQATAVTFAAYANSFVGAAGMPEDETTVFDGSSTAVDVFLNAIVDENELASGGADYPILTVSGTIVLDWAWSAD